MNDIPNGQILLDNHINTMEDFDRPPIDAIKLNLCFEGVNLRVQLIHCNEMWNSMENDPEVFKFEWGDTEAYIQETKKSPMFLQGMNVSNWTMSDETMAANGLTYEDTVAIYRIYKVGYGSRVRARTGPGCCNIYGGCRDSAQASCSPNSGPGMSQKQQYYSQKWARDGSEFERAMLEKKMHLLPTYASILQGSFNYSRFVGLDTRDWQLGNEVLVPRRVNATNVYIAYLIRFFRSGVLKWSNSACRLFLQNESIIPRMIRKPCPGFKGFISRIGF